MICASPHTSVRTEQSHSVSADDSVQSTSDAGLSRSSSSPLPPAAVMIHSSPLSLRSIPPPLNLISYPSHYVSPPLLPVQPLNGTHWP